MPKYWMLEQSGSCTLLRQKMAAATPMNEEAMAFMGVWLGREEKSF